MAQLNAPFSFSGTLDGITFYRRRDMARTLARRKTTLSRERLRTDPVFEGTRRTYTEASGRSQAAKALRRVLHPLEPVRDHNWQGALTGALTAVQYRDTTSAYGRRPVLLSHHGHLLAGYGLSRRTPFDTLLRNPLTCAVSKATLGAVVNVPALLPRVNFYVRGSQPYFQTVGVLGLVPDLFYTPYGYSPEGNYSYFFPQVVRSDWRPVKAGAPSSAIELVLPQPPPNEAFALVLAFGVLMGVVNKEGSVEAAGYAGSGKILALE